MSDDAVITVHDPLTGDVVGSVPVASESDVDAAFVRARAAQAAWAGHAARERARLLLRFHDVLLRRMDDVLDVIQSETGKARRDALTEVMAVASVAREYGLRGPRILKPQRRRGGIPILTSSRVHRVPYPVVGVISPWNYPFLLSIGDAIAALVAGSAVVIKPAELAPLSAVLARRLLVDAGMPPELVQLVQGSGEQVGGWLIERADYVCFTGSTRVGRIVAEAAGRRLVPCSLELGGKNPAIVTADADLDDVVEGLVAGAFANSGQSCISLERAYVERGIYEPLVAALSARTRGLTLATSDGWRTDVGSLVGTDHAGKVAEQVARAIADGAIAVAGGQPRPDLGPAVFEPTVLTNVPDATPLAREETFGPVIALYPVDTIDEAIARANDTEYGLNASIWAGSRRDARRIAAQVHAGSVCMNATPLAYAAPAAEMGGWGQSGLGRRHGRDGLLRFTKSQSRLGSFHSRGGFDAIIGAITSPKRPRLLNRAYALWRRTPLAR
ncbi:MAG: aldehyde dehydrogenase family protein [Thermoleophilia bacterium]|nr:aldehyde dehydrogenase family protein [Thermoleophilia bacterium]